MNILIIEDELASAQRLIKMVQAILPEATILEILTSVESSLIWLENNPQPDLMITDIHLADGQSFEIFQHVAVKSPVIFTTAYDQYAIKAFEVNAIDYLLKPIKQEELEKAIRKYERITQIKPINYQELINQLPAEMRPKNQRLLIRIGNNFKVVDFENIAYFYTQEKISFAITFDGKRYPLDHPLEKLQEMVNPKYFFRINRQFIIHIKAIKDMVAYSKSRIKLQLEPMSNMEIIVSTERSPEFKKWLIGE
jgi:two-component system response regulator LytT